MTYFQWFIKIDIGVAFIYKYPPKQREICVRSCDEFYVIKFILKDDILIDNQCSHHPVISRSAINSKGSIEERYQEIDPP